METKFNKLCCNKCNGEEFELYLVEVKGFGNYPEFDFPTYKCIKCGADAIEQNDDSVARALALMFTQKYDIKHLYNKVGE